MSLGELNGTREDRYICVYVCTYVELFFYVCRLCMYAVRCVCKLKNVCKGGKNIFNEMKQN